MLENTIPALERAVAEGADLLEFDVQATADEVLVLFHDSDLGRLGGTPTWWSSVRSQAPCSTSSCAIPPPPGAGRIPTLAALLSALPDAFPINIELKVRRSERGRIAELALAATAGRENVLFSSFDSRVLRALRQRSSAARLAPLARRWTPALAELGEELAAWSLHVGGGVARARAAGKGPPLLVYTVNNAAQARRLLAAGATGVFTDRPAPLRAGNSGRPARVAYYPELIEGDSAPRWSAWRPGESNRWLQPSWSCIRKSFSASTGR